MPPVYLTAKLLFCKGFRGHHLCPRGQSDINGSVTYYLSFNQLKSFHSFLTFMTCTEELQLQEYYIRYKIMSHNNKIKNLLSIYFFKQYNIWVLHYVNVIKTVAMTSILAEYSVKWQF